MVATLFHDSLYLHGFEHASNDSSDRIPTDCTRICILDLHWIHHGFVPSAFRWFDGFLCAGLQDEAREERVVHAHRSLGLALSHRSGRCHGRYQPSMVNFHCSGGTVADDRLSGVHFGVSMASFTYGAPTVAEADRRCGHDASQWAIPSSNNTVNYPSANESSMAASILLTSPRK